MPFIINAQFSKKEQKMIKKAEIKIINRGLDLNAAFVPYYEKWYNSFAEKYMYGNRYMDAWTDTLFEAGLEVGEFYEKSTVKDSENREMIMLGQVMFKGRYNFEISSKGAKNTIKITDLQNNNKMVASISWELSSSYGKNSFIRQYLIEELIRKN